MTNISKWYPLAHPPFFLKFFQLPGLPEQSTALPEYRGLAVS